MEEENKSKRTKESSGDGLANVLSKILAETTGTKKVRHFYLYVFRYILFMIICFLCTVNSSCQAQD